MNSLEVSPSKGPFKTSTHTVFSLSVFPTCFVKSGYLLVLFWPGALRTRKDAIMGSTLPKWRLGPPDSGLTCSCGETTIPPESQHQQQLRPLPRPLSNPAICEPRSPASCILESSARNSPCCVLDQTSPGPIASRHVITTLRVAQGLQVLW